MKRNKYFFSLLLIAYMLLPSSSFAQSAVSPDERVVEPGKPSPKAENETGSTSQEVEISEDNYRQFMELKGGPLQRDIIPETAFKPSGRLQKIEELQEDSQKHLRNQLREIILQGEQWKPGDELVPHPYVPSARALGNPSLQRQEAEAWNELVGEYHQREAEIYANSARSKAATASAQSLTSAPGGHTGKGDGSESGNKAAAKSGEQETNKDDKNSTTGSYSPGSNNDPSESSTKGVSQNALQFLLTKSGTGKAPTPSLDGQKDKSDGSGPENKEDADTAEQQVVKAGQSGAMADGAPDSKNESTTDNTTTDNTTTDNIATDNSTTGDSSAGISQNALEFLQQNTLQDQTTNVTMPVPEDSTQSIGTLSIKDLENARGITLEPGADTQADDPNDTQQDIDG